jgi:hypothetical protein
MSLKDAIDADIVSVFLNEMEFADTHNVEGKDIVCVIDSDNMVKIKNSMYLGETQADLLLFAKQEDLPKNIKIGRYLSVDAKQMIVISSKKDMGMVTLGLAQNISA